MAVAACLTPAGRGAVATVAVRGKGVRALIAERFQPAAGKPWLSYPPQRIVFGRWGTDPGEDVVVLAAADDVLEIHCHGGDAASVAVLEWLQSTGCEWQSAAKWLAGPAAVSLQTQAQLALTQATTQRTAALLLDQFHGALASAVRAAWLACNQQQPAVLEQLDQLLQWRHVGLHLVVPFQVVIAGPPNVGKSSLINALVGYRRAIVTATAGTTRDLVSARTVIDGWPVVLSDTAGLRLSTDELENAGMELARRAMSAADLVLLVCDARHGPTDQQREFMEQSPGCLLARNKSDLLDPDDPWAEKHPGSLAISALTRAGIEALVLAMGQRLAGDGPPRGTAMPFTAGQVAALEQARACVTEQDWGVAAESLRGLLTH